MSLYTTEQKRQVLIYNKDRSIQQALDTDDAMDKIMGTKSKEFFYGALGSDGLIKFEKNPAPWQDW
jgi:hypothetical protein